MASRSPGSRIVICTDGIANVGLGNLDVINAREKEEVGKLYSKIAQIAKKNGTTINVISIRGDDCSLENLGVLTDSTSGTIDVVDPIDIGSISIDMPILATNVSCEVHLNKGLCFSNGSNVSNQDVGNVTSDTDLTFSYGVKEFFTTVKELYFQAQITYTRSDGTKLLRVTTKTMPITHSREEAENSLKSSIIGMRAVRESANLAQKGDYKNARIKLISNQRLLQKGMKTQDNQIHYVQFIKQSERLDGFMRETQQQEEVFGLEKKDMEEISKNRKLARDDSAAKNIVQMKNVTKKMFEISV